MCISAFVSKYINWEFGGTSERVIPNQSADWCGNLHRIPSGTPSYSPFKSPVLRCPSTRNGTSNQEIATPVCALARNDREFDKFQFAYNRTIPSGSGKKRLQTNPVTTCLRGTRRYRAGQGKNDYRPRSSRLACGAPADTEWARRKTTTQMLRTT